ncbi:hypothetical protein L5515_017192 [Caenorhabditis briggsae]|uniref:Uncharacterized protein n=1 Tax=Caenorhabditis briggsae TaxID=6238 RepID=A0AAE9JPS7_CAEBR|nr:hypothetical protein L5515_017192 [Caenorhabditis briggsae]
MSKFVSVKFLSLLVILMLVNSVSAQWGWGWRRPVAMGLGMASTESMAAMATNCRQNHCCQRMTHFL